MSAAAWRREWLHSEAGPIAEPRVWRGVETQYASATSVLVDSLDEHDRLEELLEASKPPRPAMAAPHKHFLLTTPFRYVPEHASRFRKPGHRGLWYGALELEAACAEVAYWRMRFISDSVGLEGRRVVSRHTFFAAAVAGRGIDLMQPPWKAFRGAWVSDDYAETQRLSSAAETAGLEVIRYASARAPGCTCMAALTPDALSEPRGGLDRTRQAWTATATRDRVMMVSAADRRLRFQWKLGAAA